MKTMQRWLVVLLVVLLIGGVLLVFLQENKTYTKWEIQQKYQLNPLHSEACEKNPSSKECIDVWNICNGNPQKPVEERVTGCFDHYTIVSPDLSPIEELTGFTSEFPRGETDPNKVVYRPKKEISPP